MKKTLIKFKFDLFKNIFGLFSSHSDIKMQIQNIIINQGILKRLVRISVTNHQRCLRSSFEHLGFELNTICPKLNEEK